MKKFNNLLGLLQVFSGMGALSGGIPMVLHPDGMAQGLSLSVLANSPFKSFFLPGLLLLLVIGAGSLFGAFLSLNHKRPAGQFGMITGSALIIWIAVQLFYIGLTSWLQLVFLVVGLAQLIVGSLMVSTRKKYETAWTEKAG